MRRFGVHDLLAPFQVIRRRYGVSGRRRPLASALDVSHRRVDVVVPCYKYGHYLPGCVHSILSQEGVQVRVLVIDDCSPDDSFEVAEQLAAADPRVNIRRHDVNKGHIETYNEGLLGWADGDYTVLISADDLLAPNALRRAVQIMEADPGIGLVYGPAPYFQSNDDLPTSAREAHWYSRWGGSEWIDGRCRNAFNVISSPEVVVRTSVQHATGPYRPDLPHAGDLEMWLRVASRCDIAYVRGAPQAFYRVHDKSMQNSVFRGFTTDLWQRRAVFESFFDDCGNRVADAARLHAKARRALARQALWHAVRAYDRDDLEKIPVDRLVEFALETLPDATSTAEYHALRRRQRLGAGFCHRTQLFAAPAVWRRLRTMVRFQRWRRRGV
jgi:glycosyltransferase involved in cell wall biosynthesis